LDYPKSVPSVGLVNGQFVDEDPIAGKPGSLIPATWGNSVTQEILNVVQAAGLTPNESSNNQLLAALRSPTLFTTAPQFDGGRSAATSEFVQRALGSYASTRSISTATQLTQADVGCSIGLGGNAAYTVTLPDAAAVPNGVTISLHCRNSAPVTVASKTGTQISPQGAYLASIVLNNGESANFVRESGVWVVYGTAALKYSAFAAQLNPSTQFGYQKFPSGLIVQWLIGASDVNATMSLSLPIRFPNAVLGGVANEAYPGAWVSSTGTIWGFDTSASSTSVAVARVRVADGTTVRPGPGVSGRILVWGY
jgi:hypothetical protein